MIHHGDLFDVLPTLDADSIDACVTDPPYGLGFMAKEWDVPGGIGAFPMRRRVETDAVNTGASRQGGRQRSGPDFAKRQARDARAFEDEAALWAAEVFRVLKPGAHLVAFGGTRMFHRMACGIEDAGFEIRDCLSWLYGQGFPKSLNLPGGLGTALKPSWEPIILARKPTQGTVAQNVVQHGTAALNIDACRIDGEPTHGSGASMGGIFDMNNRRVGVPNIVNTAGRWPANVLLDEETARLLDEMTGELGPSTGGPRGRLGGDGIYGQFGDAKRPERFDSGGASRFYKIAASDCILCGLSCVEHDTMNGCEITPASTAERRSKTIRRIIASSVLPAALASPAERLAMAAPYVENLCARCVTSIALALVAIKFSGSPQQGLTVFRDSIPNSKRYTLIPVLASFAELWGNIDTIPTTQSLSLLFGSVCHAIENSTRPASLASDSDQTRFLYSAKPSREERDYGCDSLPQRTAAELTGRKPGSAGLQNPRAGIRAGSMDRDINARVARNSHPTVKPVELMRWLVKLVTPIDGVVLDPFMGSGTTGMACRYEHRRFIGIEREAEYIAIAERRIAAVAPLFGEASA